MKNGLKINILRMSMPSVLKGAVFLLALTTFFSCNQNPESTSQTLACSEFTVQNFSPITNWQKDSITQKTIFLDYNNANNGFVIPSVKDIANGLFSFEFEIKNTRSF